ncbi:hypothetical protein ACFUEM_38685 [Streptomyces anulatus]|uniref:hypothetical protein n=1 Tax=Streptomyces anulatus TaxID=1892 RepID=UPI0035E31173
MATSPLVALRVKPEVLAALREKLELPEDASGPDAVRAAISRLTGVEPSQVSLPNGGYRPRLPRPDAQSEAA